ncbi:MAG TPA: hypothetical protein VIG32_02565 [Candidatus Baltobacteraceae bacterium]|jgi:plastocyanin/predicted small lipoprotein YifL
MHKKLTIFAALALATSLAACGGGGSGGGGGGYTPPNNTPTTPPTTPTGVAAMTVGIALPTGTIGYENDPTWGQVGGFTQSTYSQVLAFPTGSTVTLSNLSSTTPHTFNVIAAGATPPANFPANPSLSTGASGGNVLAAGYGSGNIAPGGSVSVVLANAGTYLIGCAYHYSTNAMRDVIQVSANAVPGPQATPPPAGSTGGTGCKGVYC